MINCKCCGAKMKPLFTGTYCPNECDKPLPVHTSPPGPYGQAKFKQSWLWQPCGPNVRSLCCPYCKMDGKLNVGLKCGPDRADGSFDAVCRDFAQHNVTVVDDSI
jgi:hypothetical protein